MPMYWRQFRTRGVYADHAAFRRVIKNGMRSEIAPDIVRQLRSFTVNWRAAPGFEPQVGVSASGISLDVVPFGFGTDAWRWVSGGVRPRTIRPRRQFSSRINRRTGRPYRAALQFRGREGRMVYRRRVRWPGIRPRNFEDRVARNYRDTFYRKTETIVRRAVRAAQREGG